KTDDHQRRAYSAHPVTVASDGNRTRRVARRHHFDEDGKMSAKLGFLGTGAITSAMVTGLKASREEPRAILLSPRNAAVAAALADRFDNVSVAPSNQELVEECETIVIAVRPQIAQEVLAGLRFPSGANVISLVSGLPVRRLAALTAPATRISRA